MVPPAFRSLRALRVLNVAAVGLSLAACVSTAFTFLIHNLRFVGAATGVPTLLLGMLWASLLRRPGTIGKSRVRWGWLLSVPLAALNGALACGLTMMEGEGIRGFVLGLILGATIGVIAWLPGLLGTLLLFGLPIAAAQRQAAKGLAGEEHGEWIVGLACAVLSAIGLLFTLLTLTPDAMVVSLPLICAFGILGFLTGGVAAVLAWARQLRRRVFVNRAEAGEIPGYRVDPTEEGKVLVRIVSAGEGYRVKDFDQEVFELDAEGEATRPRALSTVARP